MRSAAALLLLAATISCGSTEPTAPPSDPAKETYAASLGVDLSQMTKLSPDLYILDQTIGTGATPTAGSHISASYTLYLVNGTKVESGTIPAPGSGFVVRLGYGDVIPGWDQGIPGMKVGGSRRLIIGSALGYGATGSGAVPPNATLIFDMKLLSSQ